jgi:hypothetical protein
LSIILWIIYLEILEELWMSFVVDLKKTIVSTAIIIPWTASIRLASALSLNDPKSVIDLF